jgi:hypothetical protein
LLLFLTARDEECRGKFILPEREKHVIVFALSSPCPDYLGVNTLTITIKYPKALNQS